MSSRILPEFDLLAPQSAAEAVDMLSKYQDKAAVMAGGTDLLVLMKAGLKKEYVITLSDIPGLNYIVYDPAEGLKVGAMATLADVVTTPEVKKNYPALWESASVNGTPQTRNAATLVGNILRGSPAGDCCCAVLALGGKVVLQGAAGRREVDIDNFWLTYRETARKPFEFAVELKLPAPSNGVCSAFQRMTRVAQDLSKLNGAVRLDMSGNTCQEARLAMGCVAPTPVRLKNTEALLKGKQIDDSLLQQVQETVRSEVTPIDDVRSSAWYRTEVSGVFMKRVIQAACKSI